MKIEPKIIRLGRVESVTRKVADLSRIRGAEGTVIIAKVEESAKCSNFSKWHSPLGGLYLSALLLPKDISFLNDLIALSVVALSQSVAQILPKSNEVSVMWPDDCLVNMKKIGGITCDSLGEKSRNLCAVGIRLNVRTSASDLSQVEKGCFPPTSMAIEGADLSVEDVSSILLKKLFMIYELYREKGFLPIKNTWDRFCKLIGKEVEFESSLATKEPQKTMRAVLLGMDDGGGILLSHLGETKTYREGRIVAMSLKSNS